tara:strand:+ start:1575 stop:2687 length:1113 start_codon:yes stop_codon:yes gene_type:complete
MTGISMLETCFMKNFLIIFISVFATLILADLSYNYFFRINFDGEKLDQKTFYTKYTKQENDKSLPLRHKLNGGECVIKSLMRPGAKMNWHPRFGANNNDINIDCINQLFQSDKINIIFFGGSVMANDEAPNYLTSIEYYGFNKHFDKYRTINLANSGARMSNNLSSFIEHVPKINNVDFVIFVDGMNDFTAVQLGSNPEFDTYWAQGVKDRINNPKIIIIEKLISKSITFELIFKYIFKYQSIRDKSNIKYMTKNNIIKAAEDYNYRKKISQIYCNAMDIKCHYVLHPSIYFDDTKRSYNNNIAKYYAKNFSENSYLYNTGYNHIIKSNSDIINFSKIFNNYDDIFVDSAHFNKKGSKLIGEKLFTLINN